MTAETAKSVLRDPKHGNVLYMPIEHPAFKDWEVKQPCWERMAMMNEYLGKRAPGELLDVGCHTGWFCRQFARLGWNVIGIERSRPWIEVARWLNDALAFPGKVVKPGYVNADVRDSDLTKFDVALCLSVAMYLFDDVRRGWETMRKISELVSLMFFDAGGQYAKRLPFAVDGADKAILNATAYERATLLGPSSFEDRPVWAFERAA